ncbi:MAG: FtsQ-type POTRA domain-containing protein [Anaerolineae bacterium]|nr:FtsQ-type POTRA domain-containing protein [Anaerolineae bacterium]
MSREVAPAQPSWRRKPTRPRARLRKLQSTAATTGHRPARRTSAPARGKTGMRLPDKETVVRWARRAFLIALVGGFGFGLAALLHLSFWRVSATTTLVGGTQRLTPQTVYEAGGLEGRNIFLVRSEEVAAAVRQLPGVRDARVHVRLPNQVVIDVWEYVPLVAWRTITATVWLAEDGSPVPQAGEPPPLTLDDSSGTFPTDGNQLTAILLKDLKVLHELLPEVRELSYSREKGLTFRTSEGWEVWLGEGGAVADKLRLLSAARQEITRLGRQIRFIDLRRGAQQAIWW